jgi:DNA-binding protein HU-beta
MGALILYQAPFNKVRNIASRSGLKGFSMNKQELLEAMVDNKQSGLETKLAAERALTAVLEAIEAGLSKDSLVQLVGFGTFSVKDRAARTGRNPSTGAEIQIEASRVVGFKPGSSLKESAKNSKAA